MSLGGEVVRGRYDTHGLGWSLDFDPRGSIWVTAAADGRIGLDEELDPVLEGARRGEEWAVARLWTALNPAVERYLLAIVGQAAQDVASETWLQAARDLPGFHGDTTGFRVWLFRIARNRAIDELRRRSRRREEPVAEPGEWGEALVRDAAIDAQERWDTARAVALVARLPRDQAEAVLLRVVAGLDAKQSAVILGKRPGAVRIAAMRGLRNLADLVEEGSPRHTAHGASTPTPPEASARTTEVNR